jgi:hypothetical protein
MYYKFHNGYYTVQLDILSWSNAARRYNFGNGTSTSTLDNGTSTATTNATLASCDVTVPFLSAAKLNTFTTKVLLSME